MVVFVALAASLGIGQPALAGGVSAGPVMQVGVGGAPDYLGLRGTVDGRIVSAAVERYDGPMASRTRGEAMLHVPLALGRGVEVEPVLGFIPFDYVKSVDGTVIMSFSGTAGLRVRVPLAGRLALVLEPVRIEGRVARIIVMPDAERTSAWETHLSYDYSSAAALALRW